MSSFYQLTAEEQTVHLEALAQKALNSWGMADADIELIKHRENAVFSVHSKKTGERYALRIHRHGYHSDTGLNSELQWMKALSEFGVSTTPVIPTTDNKLFALVDYHPIPEPRQCDLLGWINGHQLGTIEGEISSDPTHIVQNYRTVGHLAGLIHNQSSTFTLPEGFSRQSWDDEGLLGENPLWGRFWELEQLTDNQCDLLFEVRIKLRDELEAFGKTPDRYSLIHADFLPENLLHEGNGEIRIIDFDDSGFGWHLFEFATSLFFHLGEPHFEAVRDAMIEGYREVRPLPDNHLKMLPSFLLMRGLVYLGWAHTRRETETAKALTGDLIKTVIALAEDYLASKRS